MLHLISTLLGRCPVVLTLAVVVSDALAQTVPQEVVGPPGRLTRSAYAVRAFDGRVGEGELVRLIVPDRRGAGSSGLIELAALRLSSTAAEPASPIVFLMGGPGVPATLIARIPPYWTLFERLRAVADVILLDQRGVGESRPHLDCGPPSASLPADMLTSRAALLGALDLVYGSCRDSLIRSGVDPTAYTVAAIADDVADLAKALGIRRISLLGFSFGTRLALEVVRRHPEVVDRVALQGTLGPDHLVRRPPAFDSMLVRMAAFAAADSITESFSRTLVDDFRELVRRSGREPFLVRVASAKGDSVELAVGPEGLQALVQGRVTDRRVPALIATMSRGDGSVLRRFMEGLYRDLAQGGGSLMGRTTSCSSPASSERVKRASSEQAALLGEPFDNMVVGPTLCARLGMVTEAAAAPVEIASDRPTLFITGTLDERTPPENAEELLARFPNGIHVQVEHGGHELLPDSAVRNLVVTFFMARPVTPHRLRQPRPTFASIEEARRPPRPPGGPP